MPLETADAVLVGCGDLGTQMGLELTGRGLDVLGIRRRTAMLPEQLRGLSLDLTDPSTAVPPLHTDLLVIALTADARDEQGYARTYVEGMGRALAAVAASGHRPRRAVLVSSTGVFGDVEGHVDEQTPAAPSRRSAQVLLRAESDFLDAVPHGTVARLSGLYGPGRDRLARTVRAGDNRDPCRWTNRIHRDDAAAAVAHLLTREPGPDEAPEPLLVLTDDEPALSGDVAAYIAGELGLPWPPDDVAQPREAHGKRLSNARLRASGFALSYPTYRQGYAAVLAGDGTRHA